MGAERPDSSGESGEHCVSDAAARWLARRDRGLSPQEDEEFRAWLAETRNAAEIARLEAAWRKFDAAQLVPEIAAMAAQLDRETTTGRRAAGPVWPHALAAAAATIAMLAGLAWWQIASRDDRKGAAAAPAHTYKVVASSARRVVFEDGSAAEVRDGGDVRADYTNAQRRITLVAGEAHFTVTKDAKRPFVVSVGGTAVRAVGTAFNVKFAAAQVEILVTEGTVQVEDDAASDAAAMEPPVLVVAGQRAVLERAPGEEAERKRAKVNVTAAAPAEIEQALAWQDTRLVFDRTPLAEAVEAFNRHAPGAPGMRLVIGDSGLRGRQMGGTFRATNVEGFVRLLEQGGQIRVERRDSEIVLLPVR